MSQPFSHLRAMGAAPARGRPSGRDMVSYLGFGSHAESTLSAPWESATPVPITEGVGQGQMDTRLCSPQDSTLFGRGLCRPACHCPSPAGRAEGGDRGPTQWPLLATAPTPTLKTKKGVKVLNIKLSRTPPLPTYLGGIPNPGTICGPAPNSPRAKTREARVRGYPQQRC